MPKLSLLIPRLLAVSLFALIVPASAFAQPTTHADLSLSAPHSFTTNDPTLRWVFSLRNDGPEPARNVLVSVQASEGTVRFTNCPHVSSEGCLFPVLGAGVFDSAGVGVEVEEAPLTGDVTVTAVVSSPVHDPNPLNNRIATTFTRSSAPSLRFSIRGDGPAGPGERVRFEANLLNDSPFEAREVRFSFDLPEGWSFRRSLSDSLDCTSAGRAVTCAMGDVEAKGVRRAEFELEAPDEPHGSIHYEPVTVTTSDGVFGDRHRSSLSLVVFRDLAVTNTLDDGEGSLRKAIEIANAECGTTPAPPCRIMFEIPDNGSPVQTIRPLTGLPAITASGMTIEGATQTERVGDTNPDGPEIEINGSLVDEGNGLELQKPFTLRNVVINGFPQNGVLIAGFGTVEGCVIGADPAGASPVPNGLRGVTVTADDYNYNLIKIRNNLISGNRRSGIFVTGSAQIQIIGNRIGVAAGPDLRPLPNGASGIYFGPRTSQALAQKNVIAFNAHAGIGSSPGAEHIAIQKNAIFDNGWLAIDRGLDGVSSEGISFHTPPVPIINFVFHDAHTGTTTIRGTFDVPYRDRQNVVELFASDSADPSGYGEAQSLIGEVGADGSFELRYEGELGGRYVTANGTWFTYGFDQGFASTSEMSRAVRVEGEADEELPPSASVPDGADLSIEGRHFGDTVPSGVPDIISFRVDNQGPRIADDVMVEIKATGGVTLEDANHPCMRLGDTLRCTLGTIEVAGGKSIEIGIRTPLQAVRQVVEAVVSTQTLDPNPRNNEAVLELDVTAEPVWEAHLTQSHGIADPGELVVFNMTLAHQSGLDASDVRVTLPIPDGWAFVDGPDDHWQCGQVSSSVVCRTPVVTAGAVESLTFTIRAPEQHWGDGATSPNISSSHGEPRELPVFALFETWTWLPVTSASDSGPGSLRAALDDLNRLCRHVPCKIVFEIPEDEMEAGAAVIRPLTPLPGVGTDEHFKSTYEIDGRTQPRDSAVATTSPIVVLDGSLLTEGNGLELGGRQASVRGLTIQGFPRDGVVVRMRSGNYSSRSLIADSYIGTDSKGQTAVPNGRWGVSTVGGFVDLVSNVISGNRRSAVSAATTWSLRIVGNQIGVAAGDSSRPIPNGASGIYVAGGGQAEISGNTIANSAHFGVAISREADSVAIRGNSIFANGGIGIDYGLDSVTFNDDPDRPENLPPYPIILSAYWDESVQATRIEGTVEWWGLNGGVVELFRNATADPSGFGEARELIATVPVAGSREEKAQHFSVLVDRDLRGQVVASTWTRHHGSGNYPRTSEISAAVPVH